MNISRRIITAMLLCLAVSISLSAQEVNPSTKAQKEVEKVKKEALKEAAKAQKEAEKAKKEALKEAAKAQKEAEKAHKQALKEAEKAKKEAEKEAAEREKAHQKAHAEGAKVMEQAQKANAATPTPQADARVRQLEEQLAQRDRTLADLRRQLDEALQREQALTKRVEAGDISTLSLANNYLEKPYDAKVAADLKRRLEAITTPSLDDPRKEFIKLYDNYPAYYQEILSLLRKAGSDVQMDNPLSGRETAQSYLRQLQQTNYYRNCYHNEYNIPFLNNVIDEASQRLRNNNPQAGRIAKFGDLFQQKK